MIGDYPEALSTDAFSYLYRALKPLLLAVTARTRQVLQQAPTDAVTWHTNENKLCLSMSLQNVIAMKLVHFSQKMIPKLFIIRLTSFPASTKD